SGVGDAYRHNYGPGPVSKAGAPIRRDAPLEWDASFAFLDQLDTIPPPSGQSPTHMEPYREIGQYGEDVDIQLAGSTHRFSSTLLRDLCECARCVDPSTRQKLFSTADIPADIRASVWQNPTDAGASVDVRWKNDISGYGPDHESVFDVDSLHRASRAPNAPPVVPLEPKLVLWSAQQPKAAVPDVDYASYMSEDAVLHQALVTLRTHGLLFLTGVPESADSVSAVVNRIGPLKNTFYGSTWDVRSVPQAKNVAYTSQDLGFHMDLLYMEQPPHLQFLHCIRSSSAGGASLFTDSFRAAGDLWAQDRKSFKALTNHLVPFHYDHPGSHHYHRTHRTIELRSTAHREGSRIAELREQRSSSPVEALEDVKAERTIILDGLRTVSWAPPFQAPFVDASTSGSLGKANMILRQWRAAAAKFSKLIHKPSGIYERMMQPGECVIFDNRRILHARKAFEVGDAGKERWLRGAYMDLDPYLSKLRVLGTRYGMGKGDDVAELGTEGETAKDDDVAELGTKNETAKDHHSAELGTKTETAKDDNVPELGSLERLLAASATFERASERK
ncbi:hypothetical protein LTR53_006775, partial [Teratosphaeriaceae sp. CCFEE 6253]